MSKEALHLQY